MFIIVYVFVYTACMQSYVWDTVASPLIIFGINSNIETDSVIIWLHFPPSVIKMKMKTACMTLSGIALYTDFPSVILIFWEHLCNYIAG